MSENTRLDYLKATLCVALRPGFGEQLLAASSQECLEFRPGPQVIGFDPGGWDK